MSHYKFKHSRHGSLSFLPRKRSSHHRDKETHKLRVRRSYSSGSMGKKICSTDGTSTPTRSMNQQVCIISVSISLQGLGLSGELAASSLCRVRGLVALSLASNGFEGQVPVGLAALGVILQVLDLGENLLSGVLHPALFGNLTSLLNCY
ncbi:putative inactive leucine-rich repeat receptor-like protein kinase [Zea mays]|uniref:Putative inactive leucine-rich repeat receptor-like protein kinase n=1 Tax=Zea mays TaxID=4577 RepID=A0A1D6N2V7_MAIZE|nr:putative inactive leucine-rich repeat receptor-like protein kinase [Zea mays]